MGWNRGDSKSQSFGCIPRKVRSFYQGRQGTCDKDSKEALENRLRLMYSTVQYADSPYRSVEVSVDHRRSLKIDKDNCGTPQRDLQTLHFNSDENLYKNAYQKKESRRFAALLF